MPSLYALKKNQEWRRDVKREGNEASTGSGNAEGTAWSPAS